MPRVAASNGIRPEIRALQVIRKNKPVTPDEINQHVGTGDYAAKYVSFLNTRYGFTITAQKEDRKVKTYTLVEEPEKVVLNETSYTPRELRNLKPEKLAEGKKVTILATEPKKGNGRRKVNKAFNQPPAEKKRAGGNLKAANARKRSGDTEANMLLATLDMENSGEVGNFTVDRDWDSMEGINVRDLIL